MFRYALKFKAHTDDLFEHFENRVISLATPEESAQLYSGTHPASVIARNAPTYFFAIHDSVLSVIPLSHPRGGMLAQTPKISEIEINPAIITEDGVWAVDCKVVI